MVINVLLRSLTLKIRHSRRNHRATLFRTPESRLRNLPQEKTPQLPVDLI